MQGPSNTLGIRKRVIPAVLFLSIVLSALSVAALSQPRSAGEQPASPLADRSPADEIIHLRTDCSKSFSNPDGSITAVISAGPIHYRDGNGGWQDIDTTLSPQIKAGCGHSVVKSPVKVHFAETADGWQCVEIDGHSIQFAAEGASPSVGVADGSSITYPEAWPGIDLRYTVTPMGVKEEMIIKSRPAADDLRFRLRADTLRAGSKEDGSIWFTDDSGRTVGRMPAAFAEDSDAKRKDGIRLGATAQRDGSIVVRVPLDAEWLANAKYPVVLDPTFVGVSSEDGYPYRTWTPPFYEWDTSSEYVLVSLLPGCVKFDVSSLSAAVVPTSQVSVSLRRDPAYGYGSTVTMSWITAGDWPGSGVLPTLGQTLDTETWGSTFTTFQSSDLQRIVQRWRTWPDTNLGLGLTTSGADYAFYSVEHTGPPTGPPCMSFTYTLDSTVPSSVSVSSTPAYAKPDDSVDFDWSATDYDTPISQIRCDIATSEPASWPTPIDLEPHNIGTRTGTASCTAPTPSGCGSDYHVYFQAKSGAGWSATATSAQAVIIDGAAPEIRIIKPSTDELHVVANASFLIEATVTDDCSGVANGSVEVKIGSADWAAATLVDGVWQKEWTNISAGDTLIGVRARDNAQNEADVYRLVNVTAPSIVYVKPNGLDNNDGLTWAYAKASINIAITAAAALPAPREVWVQGDANPYIGQVTLVVGDTPVSDLGLYGGFAGGEDVREKRDWLTNETILEDEYNAANPAIVYTYQALNQSVDGFTIRNNQYFGVYCDCGSDLTSIANNQLIGNQGGIKCSYAGGVVVSNNTIRQPTGMSTMDGILCTGCSPTIINNVIADSGGYGISGGGLVAGNTVVGNYSGGIDAHAETTILNNVIANNYTYGVQNYYVPTVTLKYNCLYNPLGDDYFGTFDEENNIFADPSLSGYHLGGLSPCIDAGTNAAADSRWFDMDLSPRIQGNCVDIGADETSGTVNYPYELVLTAEPGCVCLGAESDLTALVRRGFDLINGAQIHFTILQGTGSIGSEYANTSIPTLTATSSVTSATAGWVVVHATATVGGAQVAESNVDVYFRACDPEPDDWPMFQHDVAHTGVTTTSLSSDLVEIWSLPLVGCEDAQEIHWSSPIVWRGRVYACTNTGLVYSAHASDGTYVRSISLGMPIHGTPCADEESNRIYVVTDQGLICGLNPDTLDVEWTCRFPGHVTGSPVVYDGVIYVTEGPVSWAGHLRSIDIATRTELCDEFYCWTRYGAVYTTPAIWAECPYTGGARAYVSDASCWITSFTCGDGTRIWDSESADGATMYSSPSLYVTGVAGDQQLFVGTDGGHLYRIHDNPPPTPPNIPTWSEFSDGGQLGAVRSTAAVTPDAVYFGSSNGYAYRVNRTSLQRVWTAYMGGAPVSSSPVISGSYVFFAADDGKLRCFGLDGTPQPFSVDLTDMTIGSSFAAADGRLYIVAGTPGERRLYCYGPQ